MFVLRSWAGDKIMTGHPSAKKTSLNMEMTGQSFSKDSISIFDDEKMGYSKQACQIAPFQEQLIFRISLLESRVRQLELIAHKLLRDKLSKKIADEWLDVCQNEHSIILSTAIIDDACDSLLISIERTLHIK